jgi:hypothetical protein
MRPQEGLGNIHGMTVRGPFYSAEKFSQVELTELL